jgi:hypothetical protein
VKLTDQQRALLELLVKKEEEGRGPFHLASNFGGCWGLCYSHGHNVPGEFDVSTFNDLEDVRLIRLTCLTPHLLYTGKPTLAGMEVIRNNVSSATSAPLGAGQPKALKFVTKAMEELHLNVPNLTDLVATKLKRQRKTVDRSTIYRIIDGTTRHPDPATREAIIEILKLPDDQAIEVREFFAPLKNSK